MAHVVMDNLVTKKAALFERVLLRKKKSHQPRLKEIVITEDLKESLCPKLLGGSRLKRRQCPVPHQKRPKWMMEKEGHD